MIRAYQQIFNRILVIVDVAVIFGSLLLSWGIRVHWGKESAENMLPLRDYAMPLVFIIPIFLLVSYVFELYSSGRRRRFTQELINIFKANLITLIITMALLFFVKEIDYSRILLFIFFMLNVCLMALERGVLRVILKLNRAKGFNKQFMLVIGAGSLGQSFVGKIKRHGDFGYDIIGFLDDDISKKGESVLEVPVLGRINELDKILGNNLIDEVIIALPLDAYPKLGYVVGICEKYGIKSQIIPDYYDYIPARPKIDELDGMPLINTRHVPLSEPLNKMGKRFFDMAFSLIVLLLLSPLLLAIAIGVKLSSQGPVFYKQERVGLNRRPIFMYKFRSMRIAKQGEDKTSWSSKDDPRKTRFGEFLRRTSLDELPQFWNVLIGDMSVIGPRPERPYFVKQFKESIPKYMIKHQIRPGITGWAQVNGWRGDTSMEERIKCDLYYVENWSWALDLKIIVMTVLKGFINKNAY